MNFQTITDINAEERQRQRAADAMHEPIVPRAKSGKTARNLTSYFCACGARVARSGEKCAGCEQKRGAA